jgi:hypothetical protein
METDSGKMTVRWATYHRWAGDRIESVDLFQLLDELVKLREALKLLLGEDLEKAVKEERSNEAAK